MSICHFNEKAIEYNCSTISLGDALVHGELITSIIVFIGFLSTIAISGLLVFYVSEGLSAGYKAEKRVDQLEKQLEEEKQ